MNEQVNPKSNLIPVGIALILLGLLLPRPIAQYAGPLDQSGLRSILFILTDLFRLGFFIGLTCLAIGFLRKKRQKKELETKAKS